MGRKRTTTLIAVAASILSVGLCGTGAAAVPLQLKLDKGKTYYQRTMVEQRFTQTVMGQQQVIDQSMGTGLKLDVLDVDSQGNMRIRQTFNWSRFKAAGPMANVDYDSAKPATQATGAEPFAAILGQSYVIKVSPKGQVLDVNGVDELREAVLKKLPAGGEAGPALNILDPYFKKQSVKEMTENLLAVYPEKPVEVGESWTEKKVLTLGFGMITESKWTLQKREAGVATIAATNSIRSNPDAPLMDAQGMKIRFDVSGTSESTIRVDEATGLILIDQAQSQLKGQIKLSTSADGPSMMDIPVIFDTTSKVEMSDKMWEPATK